MSIFHVFEKDEKQSLDSANYMHSYLPGMYESCAVFKQANHLSIENYVTRCTLFCDYCEILRNKHVELFKIGLNWT